MSKAIVILGYGVFEKSNSNYKNYIDRALSFIKENNFNQIIICGGFTNHELDISEAASIRDYVTEKDPSRSSQIILEEKSITTPQNLEFASKIISSPIESIMVICDSIRSPKVYYLALRYFYPEVTEEQIYRSLLSQALKKKVDVTKDITLEYENLAIQGLNLNRGPQEIGDQIIATMEEIAATNYPEVDKDILEYKKKLFKVGS